MSRDRANDREIRPRVHREPELGRPDRPALITGGAGFIGANLADRLLRSGRDVIVLDNLSRPGVERNLAWLRSRHGERLDVHIGDIRDRATVSPLVEQSGQVFHFAAQVAVTTSLLEPVEDFEVNASGTLVLLEAIRGAEEPPPLLFTSTNKVYGALEDIPLVRTGARYAPRDRAIRMRGVAENRPLDFHSPYGCSKGAADQYVLDYARSYGLRTAVFRMSCIYGPRQFGTEDQGWVAHFLIRALDGQSITLYGDGKQVRDVLFVDDLVDAFLLAERHMDRIAGEAFNIGGGAANTTSLLELVERIASLTGERPAVTFERWRTGDQRYYVSDTSKFTEATGWRPAVGVEEGTERLYAWLREGRPEAARVRKRASVSKRAPERESGIAVAEELA